MSTKKTTNFLSKSLAKSTKIVKRSIFGISVLSFALGSLTTLAQNQGSLGVMPTTSDPKNTQTKNWFLEKVEPGGKISQVATVSNFYKEDKEIEVRAKDNIQTRDGSWDFRNNEVEDEFLGKWVKLEKNKINVAAGKSSEVKFEINVPSNAKSGEYGGVIAAQLPTVPNAQGVAIENRVGSRIYLTVPGELKMAVKMDKFEFLSPKSLNYNQSTSDKVAMQLNLENTGNIFTKSFGKVQITSPDGVVDQVVDKDLAPRQSPFLFNFTTNKVWQVGKYKAKIELNNRPIINNKGEIADSSPAKVLETEFEMTQEIISTIAKDRQNPAGIIAPEVKKEDQKAFVFGGDEKVTQNDESKKEVQKEVQNFDNKEVKKEEKSDMMPIILGSVVILGLIIIILLVFLLKKKGQKEEKETSLKTNSNEISGSQNSAVSPKTNETKVQAETVKYEKIEEKLPEQE